MLVFCGICYAAYNLTFGQQLAHCKHYMAREAKAPVVQAITQDYRPGHAITFTGKMAIPFMWSRRAPLACFPAGGAAEIADSDWFDYDPNQVEDASITLSPIMVSAAAKDGTAQHRDANSHAGIAHCGAHSEEEYIKSVNTSVYPVEVQIIPGSTISLNGR